MASFGGSCGQVFLLHEFDVGQRGGAGDRVAAKGGEVVSRLESCGNLGPGGEGAQWKTVGDAFGSDQNVRVDSVVLVGEHLAGAAEAGLDFVGNEQNAVLV